MRVLIFGKNGQLAKCLADTTIVNFDCIFIGSKECNFLSLTDIENTILSIKPDIVVNCSAYTNVENSELLSEQDNVKAINVNALNKIAKITFKLDIPVIHISTDYVFDGETTSGPYTENDPTDPINSYGLSKLHGENELIENNPKHIIIRASWLFSEHGNNFFVNILKKLKTSVNDLKIVDDQIGGPTYCGDLAKVISNIVSNYIEHNQIHFGLFHYSGYPYVSWFGFADNIVNKTKELYCVTPNVYPIKTSDIKLKANRPKNASLSVKKIHKIYSVQPSDWKNSLNDIIEKVWNNESN